jgi:outer membrane biosynthesis protein TonB
MKKASEKERGSHGIGLATEHRLPEAFKARTDDDAGIVEIKKEGVRPLNIAINSFGAVSNLLAIFSPDGETSLEPGHTIKIVDEFNNRSATITANTFVDIAAALNTFVVERGKYLPSAHEAEASASAPQEVVPSAKEEAAPADTVEVAAAPAKAKNKKAAAAKTAKAKAPETAVAPAPAPEPVKKAAAKQAKPEAASTETPAAAEKPAAKAPAAAKEPSKAKPAKAAAPTAPSGWTKSLPVEHVDADGGFRLDARTLALTKEKAKTASGVSDGSAEHEAFGYEVSEGTAPGGRHLGYIIVEDPKSWIVTGFGDIPFSKHANLNAAAIRIRVTNLPRMR